MGRLTVLALRVLLVMLFAGMLVIQGVILPLLGIDISEESPETATLGWVVVGIGIAGVLTVEVALVCVWKLLTMVKRDTVFSAAAFRYVDVIIGSAVAATLLAVALTFALAPGEAVPPGFVLVVVIAGVGTAGIAVLVLVLRQLLVKAVALDSTASTLRAELDEVI
ncbi:DUF2975 domain-containing protein [Cellulomonas chitinilytica]|uniref:DUF2975 domain-containing protein n=1 Tax=Cellulomonas chitinilytica TaxID=398759 RepID=UPI0019410B69|nr:DUF2975 domain-containing protein [Cellulomonas chitinilytica]